MANPDDGSLRILCIEDDPALQMLLKLGLTRYGFEVITATHGIDAMMQYRAQEGRFDAVLSDHDLPYLNGLELVRRLREMGYEGRIVVMSGRLSAGELYEYAPYAISGFFHKPFEIGLLATMLQRQN